MHKTYRTIAKHIRKELPEISWIDRDKGQLNDPGNFHSIITPGLLLHFGNVTWTGLGGGRQQGFTTMRASLIFNLPPSTYASLDDPLKDYQESNTLSMRLHDTLKTISLIGERRASVDYFTPQYYVCAMDYDCEVIDTVELCKIQKPAPIIQAKIKLPIQ